MQSTNRTAMTTTTQTTIIAIHDSQTNKKAHQLFAEYLLSAICVKKGGGNLRLALLPHIPSVCLTISLESFGFHFVYLSFVCFYIRCILVFLSFGVPFLDCIRNSNCLLRWISLLCFAIVWISTNCVPLVHPSTEKTLCSVARPMCPTLVSIKWMCKNVSQHSRKCLPIFSFFIRRCMNFLSKIQDRYTRMFPLQYFSILS